MRNGPGPPSSVMFTYSCASAWWVRHDAGTTAVIHALQTGAGAAHILSAATELAKNGARQRAEVEQFLQMVRAA